MTRSNILSAVSVFIFGVLVGGFGALTIIREAVPLREHFYTVLSFVVFGIPIMVFLFLWYLKVIGYCKRTLGEKGGTVIGSILTFQIVSVIIIFILVVAIFYSTII